MMQRLHTEMKDKKQRDICCKNIDKYFPRILFIYFVHAFYISCCLVVLHHSFIQNAYADEDGQKANAQGWHWYNWQERNQENKLRALQNAQNTPTKVLSATETMKLLQALTKESLDKAILYPSEENIRDYIVLQNYIMSHSSQFSLLWQKTLLDYPVLNYTIAHPTENNAQHVQSVVEESQETAAIQALSKVYGLFFFYRGNNLLDQTLAPIIKGFADENHVSLIPISVDGVTLPIFPESRMDQGQAQSMHIQFFPALVLVDPTQGRYRPINYGFITVDELKKRYLEIATNFST